MNNFRRQIKNVAYNYTPAQVLAREASSNSPFGPTEQQLYMLASAVKNPRTAHEVMTILWKRISDSGKNWRHVYKSLVILAFLIRVDETFRTQLKASIYAIDTLKDFQHVEEGMDQGLNVRQKACELVDMLNQEEPLQPPPGFNDRNNYASGSYNISPRQSSSRSPNGTHEAPPNTLEEEDAQLRLALKLSMDEQKAAVQVGDDFEERLKKAIELSMVDVKAEPLPEKKSGAVNGAATNNNHNNPLENDYILLGNTPKQPSAIDDLLSMGDPFASQLPSSSNWQPAAQEVDWSTPVNLNPWNDPPKNVAPYDAWASQSSGYGTLTGAITPAQFAFDTSNAPCGHYSAAQSHFGGYDKTVSQMGRYDKTDYSEENRMNNAVTYDAISDLDLLTMGSQITPTTPQGNGATTTASFLGMKTAVNLDDLVEIDNLRSTNPFLQPQKTAPTLNEMRVQNGAFPTPPISPYQNGAGNRVPVSNYNPFG